MLVECLVECLIAEAVGKTIRLACIEINLCRMAREQDVESARSLRKLWSRRLSWDWGWRRNLECWIVQLQGRAKIESGPLWWLNSDDSLTIGQNDRVLDDSCLIFVHVNAAFGSQDLFQAFLCAWLGRWLIVRCGQETWSYDYEGYNDTENDRSHESIIHLARIAGIKASGTISLLGQPSVKAYLSI